MDDDDNILFRLLLDSYTDDEKDFLILQSAKKDGTEPDEIRYLIKQGWDVYLTKDSASVSVIKLTGKQGWLV